MRTLLMLVALVAAARAGAHGISAADQAAMLNGGMLRYVQLGATHMLTGYDHLLFLFGVVFFLENVRDVVKFVTAFTFGHSVTLILATFLGIKANPFAIDAVIAISVCYKAIDNNGYFQSYLQMRSPNVLIVVLVFGLIHGFGLSTRLQQLPLGAAQSQVLARIVSFNVGVELGQVAALIPMVLVLRRWRRADGFAHASKVANDCVLAVGVLLVLMQMHGYLHTTSPDDFGFAEDSHAHAHAHDADPSSVAVPTVPLTTGSEHDNL
jgi:HupE / UreJ protein